MVHKKSTILLAVALSVTTLTGCISSTKVTITSNAPDAELYIDNQYVGVTPYTKKMSNLAWEQHELLVKKEGFSPSKQKMQKELKVFNTISGLFLWMPSLLFSYGPKPNQYISLYKLADSGESNTSQGDQAGLAESSGKIPVSRLKGNVAVVGFEPQNSFPDSKLISTLISTEFENRLYSVDSISLIDRKNIDAIFAEQKFQLSGSVSDEQIKGIGNFLGADSLIYGTVSLLDSAYFITVKIVEVQTSKILFSGTCTAGSTRDIKNAVGGLF